MLQAAVRELHAEGITQGVSYIHPENRKMKGALQKWSHVQELQDMIFRQAVQGGELVYVLDLEAKKLVGHLSNSLRS